MKQLPRKPRFHLINTKLIYMRYLVTALAFVVLCSCNNSSLAQKKVVIIGSSTSACYNVSYTDCYVGRLDAYYNRQAPFDTAINKDLATGGYTVYKGMPTSYVSPYSDPNFQPDPGKNITYALANMNPNVILVNFPTNGYDVLSVSEVMFCLRTIRDSANIKGIPCFVTTTQPRTDAPFNNPAVKRKLADLKDSILLQFGSFALDFYTGMFEPSDSSILAAYHSTDDIHFNGTGHAVLAQRVEAANIFSAAALPATFLQYQAIYNGKTILVSWATAQEAGIARYEIQRSADGTAFTKLGELDPHNGSGPYTYQYTDAQPLKGWNYYKIIIADHDGKKQSSAVFKAFSDAGRLALKKMITQSSQVILELQSAAALQADLQVLSSTGLLIRKAMQHIDNGNSTLTINTTSLSSGIYYIKLATAGGESIITSFIKN